MPFYLPYKHKYSQLSNCRGGVNSVFGEKIWKNRLIFGLKLALIHEIMGLLKKRGTPVGPPIGVLVGVPQIYEISDLDNFSCMHLLKLNFVYNKRNDCFRKALHSISS